MLVVDDEAMNVEVLVSMLREMGIESDSCLGAIFALPIVMDRIKKVQEGTAQMYKLVLLDYSMPQMDGP